MTITGCLATCNDPSCPWECEGIEADLEAETHHNQAGHQVQLNITAVI